MEKQIKAQYLKNDVYSQQIQQKWLTMFVVDKQSNSGYFYNQRAFLIYHTDFIGYARSIDQNLTLPLKSSFEFPALKLRARLATISNVEKNQQTLEVIIKFKIPVHQEIKQWVIRFSNRIMLLKMFTRCVYCINQNFPFLANTNLAMEYKSQTDSQTNNVVNKFEYPSKLKESATKYLCRKCQLQQSTMINTQCMHLVLCEACSKVQGKCILCDCTGTFHKVYR